MSAAQDPVVAARRAKVATLYNGGLSSRRIAAELGVPRHTVDSDVHWLRYRTSLLSAPAHGGQPVIRPARLERFSSLTTVEEDLEADVRALRAERGGLLKALEATARLREERDGARKWAGALAGQLQAAVAARLRAERSLAAQRRKLAAQDRRRQDLSTEIARMRQVAGWARERLAQTGEFTAAGGQLYRKVAAQVPLVQGSPVPGRLIPHSRPHRRHPWFLCGYCGQERRVRRNLNRVTR